MKGASYGFPENMPDGRMTLELWNVLTWELVLSARERVTFSNFYLSVAKILSRMRPLSQPSSLDPEPQGLDTSWNSMDQIPKI